MKIKKKRKRRYIGLIVNVLLFMVSTVLSAQNQRSVTGTVKDSNGEPLVGVSIVLKGTSTGAITDIDGNYSISVPSEKGILVFSYIGFADQEIAVGNRNRIDIIMKEDAEILDEVVVVGFGTQKKVNLTGAVANVGQEVFENRPVTNVGQALQGVVPNLNVSFSSGAPNTNPSFNIRGGTSFKYNTGSGVFEATNGAPLIIIDGIESSESQLNQLNPNDISSLSVIKDASAAAIYGTKATYGVILVQTKRGGFNQKAKISYSYDVSFDTPAALPDILDAYTLQVAQMNKTTWTGGSPSSSDEQKLEMIEKYMQNPTPENAWYMDGNRIVWVANMNPFEESVRTWTPTQKHNLSFSGGGDAVNYYVSFGYQDQEGMYKINTDQLQRYNLMSNLNAKINKWANLFVKLGFDQTDYETPYIVGGKGSIWSAMMGETNKNINMPIKTGPNDPLPNTYTDNILAWLSYGARDRSTTRRLSLVASPEFIVVPELLNIKADLAYQTTNYRLNRYSPKIQQVVDSWTYTVQQAEAAENRAYFDNYHYDTYRMNIYADFNKTFEGQHTISAIAGFNQEQTDLGRIINTYRKLLSPDIQNPNAAEDPTLHTTSTDSYTVTGRAVFGRINYNFMDRYLLEMNMRYDGSSKFTKNERFVAFPSFSAGWRISEEPFMQPSRGWLDNLKFRASWGILGNQPSDNYPYQPVLGTGKSSYLINGEQVTYMNPPGLVSPSLTFEKAETKNLGVDAVLLSNRLDLTFEVYTRTTRDILSDGAAQYTSFLGATPPYTNSGEMKTNGFELSLQWKDRLNNGINYKVGFNLSDYQSTIIKYEGNNDKILWNQNSYWLLYPGKVIGEIWGFETGGILQESDFEPRANDTDPWVFKGPYQGKITSNLYPGYLWYKDINGDGMIDTGNKKVGDSGDYKVIGNSTPRFRYGITANVQYKNFDFDLLFQGVAKRDVFTSSSAYWGGGAGSRWMYDRSWTPENTGAKFPMYTAPINTQTGYLINGAYLRLKQAVLGYNFSKRIVNKIRAEKLRMTLGGFNIFEITQIPGVFDVDQISAAYPQKRTVTIGAQIVF